MSAPDVSIIIVSWNTKIYLARCLAAVPSSAPGLRTEVIVVDNGSTDGTQAMVRESFPSVRLIQNQTNLGFGRANNIGAQASGSRGLFLLNSDCELEPGALALMMQALDADETLGAVFCRLRSTDGALQPSIHRTFPSPWSLIGDLFFVPTLRYAIYRRAALHQWLLQPTIRAHTQVRDVAWGGAACMLVRRTAFETVGGFDEGFFMYCEDVDLCKRLWGAGFRLRYLPDLAAVHHWGRSTLQFPSAMLREAYRSRLYYFGKHFPGRGFALARSLSMAELRIRQAGFSVLALLPTHLRDVFKQHAEATAVCLRDLVEAPRAQP